MTAKQFWKILVHKPSGCWEWPLARSGGYGIAYIDGVRKYTHRFASEQKHGPIPPGVQVLHKCDNPPCCRPGHTYRGDDKHNRRDAIQRGRWQSPRRKLTDSQAKRLRYLYATGKFLHAELATQFKITQPAVSMICTGVTYPNAGGPITRREYAAAQVD